MYMSIYFYTLVKDKFMVASLKHIKLKMEKLFSLYIVMLCSIEYSKLTKVSCSIKPLAEVISKELDELADYFKYI